MDYFERVREWFFKQIGMTADDYANRLLLDDTTLYLFGIFILARLYRIHVGVIMNGGMWSTSRTNDIHLAKFVLIYRGVTELSETCSLNGVELYLDSLIFNTQLGRMPCHRDNAKLEGVDTVSELPVDLTKSQEATDETAQASKLDVKLSVKSKHKKETDVISSMSVQHTQPRNKLKTSMYKKSLQLLLKAKAEIKTKIEHKEKTD